MIKIFKKKQKEPWIADAKAIKKNEESRYNFLTREEIKEAILKKENETKTAGIRTVTFINRSISKEDKKELSKLRYKVVTFTKPGKLSFENIPYVQIFW